MTKRRNTTPARGVRTEADYTAAAEWAETNLPDLTGQTINSGDTSHEAAHTMLDRALGADAGDDSPVEAYTRALISRGRPSLTAPGVHSKARQVRLPDLLDARLEEHVAMTHTSRSEVMRNALEQYLDR
ncbi:MAG: ribbon-helix-helix domain-containing protein [Dermatophilaceae bacterium]